MILKLDFPLRRNENTERALVFGDFRATNHSARFLRIPERKKTNKH